MSIEPKVHKNKKALGCMLLLLPIYFLSIACVERKLFLKSDPPSAHVCLNGKAIGQTPITVPFNYYGTRDVELRLEGYKVKRTHVHLSAPWYQYFPFDLFFDVLWPFTLVDEHDFTAELEPYTPEELENKPTLLERADELRYDEFWKGEEGG